VATKPWRARRAEEALLGAPPTREQFAQAAAAELQLARTRRDNVFKVELAQRAIVRALTATIDGGVR
jgi:xanthine dehydrogenase YagS FAD-binding subunit